MLYFVLSLLVIAGGMTGLYFNLRHKETFFPIPCYYLSAILIYVAMFFISEIYNFSWFSVPCMMILTTGIVYSMFIDKYDGVVYGPALTMIFTLLGKIIFVEKFNGFFGALLGLSIGYVLIFAIKLFSKSSKKAKNYGAENDQSRDL